MPNIIINSWNGGLSSHYHIGNANQCSDMRNVDIQAHPDALIIANDVIHIADCGGKITAWVHMKEYVDKDTAGMVFVTNTGEIWYKWTLVHTEADRSYKQAFFWNFDENKMTMNAVFLVHNTGIDRVVYDSTNDVLDFDKFSKNIDTLKLSAEKIDKIPVLRWNSNILLWVGNQIFFYDGIIWQKKLKLSSMTRIVGMTAYGDYVHIYATDGESSYKAIYDPVNDDEQPWSIRNFGRMRWVSAIENESVDLVVADNDDIYQSSGLQIQKYIDADKSIYRADKNFNNVIAGYNDKIYIGSSGCMYEVIPWDVGAPPKITKQTFGDEVTFLYGTKDVIYIGYTSGSQHTFVSLSCVSGENPRQSGEYETLWYRAERYGKVSGVDIRANFHGKSGGSIEVFARRDLVDNWTKIAEFSDKKWVQHREKWVLAKKFSNFAEIQLKIVLQKSSDNKTPILYSLQLEYDNSDTAIV